MNIRKIKSIALSAIILAWMFVWLAPGARAEVLKPGEIIYSRATTVQGGNCDTGAVWAVGQDGSNDRFITPGFHPRISPDGRFLLFKRFHPSSLCSPFGIAPIWWVRELATNRETQIAQNFQTSSGHFFSPETNRGANQIVKSDGAGICLMNLDGTNRVCANIPNLDPIRGAGHPSVRGTDNLLLVQNFLDNADGGLYTLNYNNFENRQKIPNTVGRDLNPSWSNDGQIIAFAAFPTGRGEPYFFTNLFKINADGANRTQLTFLNNLPNGEGFSYSLVWTPDNSTILNAAKINGVAGIYRIAADGSGSILGTIPITPGAAPEWVGGIVPAYSEQQTASFGGGLTSGGIFSLVNTVGQGFAGQVSLGGAYNFQSGFWHYPLTVAPTTNGVLSFGNAAFSANENGATATITVTRSGGSEGAVGVSYATYDGTAAGSDYTAASGILGWNDGEIGSKTFTVAILDDTLVEGSETVNLTLSNATGGATLGSPNAATLTIVDNDAACIYSITPTAQTIGGGGGNAGATVTTANGCAWTAASNAAWLTITGGASGTGNGTVNYTAAANTTTAARSGTLTIAGQTLTVTQPIGSTVSTVNVSIPVNLTAAQNTTLNVPVNVSNTTGGGITSFDFRLTYDPAVLTALTPPVVTTGTLASGFEINVNTPTAGTLIVSGFGTAPLVGSGVLLNFRFTAAGAFPACSALSLANFGFNEGNPSAVTTNGQICVTGASISGTINYGNSTTAIAVPGARLTVAGTPAVALATTDASGNYALTGFGSGAYTVTPSKTFDTNNAITSFDASQISKHLVQTITLTTQQLAAADVSGNGAVTSFDASLIAQTILEIPNPSNTGTWRFTPVNRVYPSIAANQTGQNYTAILMGEVSGNWTPNTGLAENFDKQEYAPVYPNVENVVVGLPTKNVGVNSNFTVPVIVGETSGREISSFDFEVLYNPSVVEPQIQAVTNTGTISSEFAVGANIITPGRIRVSGYSATNLAGSGILVNLNFRSIGTIGTNSILNWESFSFNEGSPATNRVNGRVTIAAQSGAARFDFDGDGRADVSVFRPSNGVWYLNRSTNGFSGLQFGISTDRLAPADYDGDGRTDIAVWREDTFAHFYIFQSATNTFRFVQFGQTGDLPTVVGDWDGDGRADPAVYRSVAGSPSLFFYRPSSQPGVDFITLAWGAAGDQPVNGDFDGDSKLDAAVFRPADRTWYIRRSSDGVLQAQSFGLATDKLVPADYDGDGKTDIAVFRPSDGIWYLQQSTRGFNGIAFGFGTDIPTPADYDGDGQADVAVFRNGTWYLQRTTAGFTGVIFGQSTDLPVPNAFVR